MIDVAAGSTHCLALTEDSEVHSWGSNDQCQHFDTLRITKPEPAALPGLDTKHIVGIACGPAQVSFIFDWLIVICLCLSLGLFLYASSSLSFSACMTPLIFLFRIDESLVKKKQNKNKSHAIASPKRDD